MILDYICKAHFMINVYKNLTDSVPGAIGALVLNNVDNDHVCGPI